MKRLYGPRAVPLTLGDSSNGHVDHPGWGSTLDPRIRNFSGAVAMLADSRTDSLAPATGEYFIVVSADDLPASATHLYVIEKK